MLIDTHVHVGQFNDLYFAPSAVHELIEHLDVDYYAVSSTTQCEENYPKVIRELEELVRLGGRKVLPVMWITPEALKGNIAWYLDSDIRWRMLKIHPFLNQAEWNPEGCLFAEVLDISRELRLPLLVHTSNQESCQAGLYEQAVKNNPDIIFVFAHGRPIESALHIASACDNAYVDSAFMPIEHMRIFVDKGLSEKLLWGTDMCIPKYFTRDLDVVTYYKSKLQAFREVCTPEQYGHVTYRNAMKLFNLAYDTLSTADCNLDKMDEMDEKLRGLEKRIG